MNISCNLWRPPNVNYYQFDYFLSNGPSIGTRFSSTFFWNVKNLWLNGIYRKTETWTVQINIGHPNYTLHKVQTVHLPTSIILIVFRKALQHALVCHCLSLLSTWTSRKWIFIEPIIGFILSLPYLTNYFNETTTF